MENACEQPGNAKMAEFLARGFTIVDDTIISSSVPEHQADLCPCCNESLGGKILERIRLNDTGEEILLHRYHSGTNLDKSN